MKEITIVKTEQIRYDSSFVTTPFEERKITYHIQADPMKQYGSFEMYSDDTEYYAEGGMWFDKGKLVDYDGIFALPAVIINQLKKWGFEVEEDNEEI